MIIVVPSCLKDADGARTRSDQKQEVSNELLKCGLDLQVHSIFLGQLLFSSPDTSNQARRSEQKGIRLFGDVWIILLFLLWLNFPIKILWQF